MPSTAFSRAAAPRPGDLIFFGADKASVVNESLGALRVKLGHDRGLVEPGWRFLWVVDFPMFEYDEREKTAESHCTTRLPRRQPTIRPRSLRRPEEMLSRAYDMVLNGTELGGGSVRIHRMEMQQQVFELLGIDARGSRGKIRFSC